MFTFEKHFKMIPKCIILLIGGHVLVEDTSGIEIYPIALLSKSTAPRKALLSPAHQSIPLQ